MLRGRTRQPPTQPQVPFLLAAEEWPRHPPDAPPPRCPPGRGGGSGGSLRDHRTPPPASPPAPRGPPAGAGSGGWGVRVGVAKWGLASGPRGGGGGGCGGSGSRIGGGTHNRPASAPARGHTSNTPPPPSRRGPRGDGVPAEERRFFDTGGGGQPYHTYLAAVAVRPAYPPSGTHPRGRGGRNGHRGIGSHPPPVTRQRLCGHEPAKPPISRYIPPLEGALGFLTGRGNSLLAECFEIK